MGWQDNAVVSRKPAWAQDEVVSPAASATQQETQQTAPEQPNTWGQAIKNVAQSAGHFTSGLVGGFAGDLAGLGALMAPPAMIARKLGYDVDPAAIREKVSSALTYTPDNQDTLSMKVADAPGRVVQWAGEKAAAPVRGIPYLETLAENSPVIGLNALGLKGARAAGRVPEPAKAPVPTTLELKSAASNAYKAADEAGVVIRPESTARATEIFDRVAKEENLGRLPPALKDASEILKERVAKNEPLTLKEADKVRQIINDAKASKEPSDRRLAKIVQNKYDEYIDNLTPEDTLAGDASQAVGVLKDARELYKRQKNSSLVDNIERRAKNTGEANYSQAGEELALRREFLRLANKDTTQRFFSPEQQAAISKVAAPGMGANTLRNIGKMDPMKGGVPAFMATLLGGGIGSALGPAGSVAGAAGLGGLAHLANRGAQRITRNNVAGAREALVGRGLPSATSSAKPAVGARSMPQIFSELQTLDAALAQLPKSEPFDSPRRRALQQKADALRAELTLSVSTAASQR
jgi:hypothetical protein